MEGEMLKGHLDMIVLAALASGPAHGYAVIEEIRHKSGKAFDLPEGTIFRVGEATVVSTGPETSIVKSVVLISGIRRTRSTSIPFPSWTVTLQ